MRIVISGAGDSLLCAAVNDAVDPPRLVIGCSLGAILYSTSIEEEEETEFEYYVFEQVNTRDVFRDIHGIDFGSSRFIACSDAGILMRSSDGSVWTVMPNISTKNLYDIAYVTTDTWVVVGEDGTILRSTDNGISWAAVTSNVSEDLLAVAVFGAALCAVGANGAVTTSADSGATWTAETSGSSEDLQAVVGFTNGGTNYWSIVGDNTELLRLQIGGAAFEAGSSPAELDVFGVAWAGTDGSLLLAAGSGGLTITSTNGLAWSQQTSGSTSSQINAVEYLADKFVSVGAGGKIAYSATGAGIRSFQKFKPVSETMRAVAFCQSRGYMNYGGILLFEEGVWNYYPTKVISAAPGTVNDFDEEFGAWETDLPGDGAILAMASIEGGWVVARSNAVDLMTDGGSLALPWDHNDDYGEGLRIISNWATFGGAAFGVFEDGLLYRADYNSVNRLPGFFDLTQFEDFEPGTEEVQISFDPQTQKLLIFRPASPYRLFFVDDQSGSVTEFELPTFTLAGVTYTPASVFVPKNVTDGFRVGYETDDAQMSNIVTLDFMYDEAPDGFDDASIGEDQPWYTNIETGCFRISRLGMRGEISDILVRTNCDPDSTVRPRIAIAVKSEPEDDWRWHGKVHAGTIAVDGGAGTVTGTGTAFSHRIATGDDLTIDFTIPWLVEKLTEVSWEDSGTGVRTALSYTKIGARQIRLSAALASGGYLWCAAGPTTPHIRGEEGDTLLLSDDVMLEIDSVTNATTLVPVWIPAAYDDEATYVETKEMPEGDALGDGKLLFGLGEGFDQIMIKMVVFPPTANDSKWAKISGIELGYRETGPELKTDGG